MKTLEEKIKAKQYPSVGVATATVKRADISTRERNKLLELVDRIYRPETQPSSLAPTADTDKLDQQLLEIAFQLLGLCIEHKMSRQEMYQRLESRLMAGMG